MARSIVANLQTILNAPTRDIDWTVEITFPTISALKFATSSLDIAKGVYSNDLEEVSEIRQTLETPTDRVNVAIQNKDAVLGLHVANNLTEWSKAEAIIGRNYTGSGLQVWIEMFRGAVQQPNVKDLQVEFEILADTIAPGQIVCSRTLALPCPFLFKDAATCGYSGSETSCNHNLKSKTGCDGLGNSHRFGGAEHRYNPDASAPGTGGNTPIDGGPTGCPQLDQFVLVKNEEGKPVAKQVGLLRETDWLFNPIARTFHQIRSLEIIKNAPIFETVARSGARSISSCTHRILTSRADDKGQPVTRFWFGDSILTWDGNLTDSKISSARQIAGLADVLKIEMRDGHIYATGASPENLIVSHNSKNPVDP